QPSRRRAARPSRRRAGRPSRRRAAQPSRRRRAARPSRRRAARPTRRGATWSPWQWRWYLDGLARPSSLCATLDQWFNLCAAENAEVRAAWLPLAIESDYAPAFAAIEAALDGTSERGGGRIKFLRPLYVALARNPA